MTVNSPASPHVATVREFSRFYTRRLGTLGDGLLETPWSLTEARVVFELGQARSTDMAALRAALSLDSGYMSRLLAKFDAAGLVRRTVSPADGRRQSLSLTAAGRRLYRTLDERSDRQVADLLAPLPEPVQESLARAMRTVMQALEGRAASAAVVLRGLRPGDLGWLVQRHAEVYAREYGWDPSFEAFVARIAADYLDAPHAARKNAWIAEVDGQRAGCVLCVSHDAETAQLRVLLVEAWARGHRLGTLLVDECIRFARGCGYRKLVLWTNDVLVAARRIYVAAGFELVREESHHSFGKQLTGQFWELRL